MIYVDPLMNHGWKLGPSCHLFADTLVELHNFAARLGMKRQWFQNPERNGRAFPHYDLTGVRRKRAVELGAVELDRKAAVAKWYELGFRRRVPVPAEAR